MLIAVDLSPGMSWALGIFEGEGSIVTPYPHGRTVSLSIQMSDKDILERLHAIVGVGTITGPYNYNRKQNVTYKEVWAWRAHKREDVKYLLTKWFPFFGTRRRARAVEALERLNKPKKIRGNIKICKWGHEMSGDNVKIVGSKKVRQCKACNIRREHDRSKKGQQC